MPRVSVNFLKSCTKSPKKIQTFRTYFDPISQHEKIKTLMTIGYIAQKLHVIPVALGGFSLTGFSIKQKIDP